MMCSDLNSEVGQFQHTKGYSPCYKGIFAVLGTLFDYPYMFVFWTVVAEHCMCVQVLFVW